ncbi:MAG: hypothetical protein HY706_10070 [Candidatus Hydrogenedentes bacterium]|nr:hypothetical protein [Candidatus Hydrogenedentota bacterium]
MRKLTILLACAVIASGLAGLVSTLEPECAKTCFAQAASSAPAPSPAKPGRTKIVGRNGRFYRVDEQGNMTEMTASPTAIGRSSTVTSAPTFETPPSAPPGPRSVEGQPSESAGEPTTETGPTEPAPVTEGQEQPSTESTSAEPGTPEPAEETGEKTEGETAKTEPATAGKPGPKKTPPETKEEKARREGKQEGEQETKAAQMKRMLDNDQAWFYSADGTQLSRQEVEDRIKSGKVDDVKSVNVYQYNETAPETEKPAETETK